MNRELPSAVVGFTSTKSAHLATANPPKLEIRTDVRLPGGSVKPAIFVPFADAGADGSTYKVWLAAPGTPLKENASLIAPGTESCSRAGNVQGSIIDGDPESFVVTFDNSKKQEDWFAVTMDEPVKVKRIVFIAGKVFHDGGWFDSSAGKPAVQVKTEKAGKWETIARIEDYPETTATDSGPLKDGANHSFSILLGEPARIFGIRVAGKPASGDNLNQAFSSCAELQAYGN
jgi:hypothetical protein